MKIRGFLIFRVERPKFPPINGGMDFEVACMTT